MSHLTSVMKLPKQLTFVLAASIVFCTVGAVYAEWVGGPGGRWPKSWPKELEPLRKQASTWEGVSGREGMVIRKYEIPFANREGFESAWPHILKLKSKGASITLLRGPSLRVESGKTAGVRIRLPIPGYTKGPFSTTSIELVVDGKIVDLNRIQLPASVIDSSFAESGPSWSLSGRRKSRSSRSSPPAGTT